MAVQTKDKWARITIDRETLSRLRQLADGKPVAQYLRELSLGKNPKDEIDERLARIELKLNITPADNIPPGIIPPEVTAEFIADCTPENAVGLIHQAFEEIDRLPGLTERQAKDQKAWWVAFITELASLSPEEKRAMIEKIDKDNGFDSSIGQG